jgi:hypothetical protein
MESLRRVWVVLGIVALGGLGAAQAAPKRLGPPDKGPAANLPAPEAPKVIYGEDDRIDVYAETDPQRLAWAASTCALVDASQLGVNEDGTYELQTRAYTVSGLPACSGEAFASQPSAAYCTGFVVGIDLIATAGHCVSLDDFADIRFVFGFQMTDAANPVTTFQPSQVYTAVEVVGRAFSNGDDHAVLRVDRPITAPGAQVLDIRRAGVIPVGAQVGVIGHPAGLPTKLAFGENSVVRDNRPAPYFVSNLDTFGGNSGSPVFNAHTGLVEGILVRGEVDYQLTSSCFRANVVPSTGGRGEDASKTIRFAELIPGGRGQLGLNKGAYRCEDTIAVTLADLDLRGAGSAIVHVTSLAGDHETLLVTEQSVPGTFFAELPITAGSPTPGTGVLEVSEGDALIVAYEDASHGLGGPALITTGAVIDCTAPVLSNVRVEHAGGISFVVAFETSEPAVGVVATGTSCAAPAIETRGDFTTEHRITVGSLEPLTTYFFTVTAWDAAENQAASQGCFEVVTLDYADPFVETFYDLSSDIAGLSTTFTPDASSSGYHACTVPRSTFPSEATCGRRLLLQDDSFMEYPLPPGKTFPFYGVTYTRLYIGSNGYVTFGQGDDAYEPSLANHFRLPRISGYFSDLVPLAGGMTLVKEFDDRVAITFDDVPDYYGDRHSFQIELFFSGAIRLTWLKLTQPYGLVGLSPGGGIPDEFAPSDLSAYAACGGTLPDGECGGSRIIMCAPGHGHPLTAACAGDVAVIFFVLAALSMPRSYRRCDNVGS